MTGTAETPVGTYDYVLAICETLPPEPYASEIKYNATRVDLL